MILIKNRFVLFCLMAAMSVPIAAQTYSTIRPNNTAWGRNSTVTNYYYEEQRVFNSNVNLYTTQETFVQNFRSTSSLVSGVAVGDNYRNGQFYTAASSIQFDMTTQEYTTKRLQASGRGRGWEPPTKAPLSLGWDVVILLVGIAVLYQYRKQTHKHKQRV